MNREIWAYPGRKPALDEWQSALGRALADISKASCGICDAPAVEERDFETGNNAEYRISMPLCDAHANELDEIGSDFETKYAGEIFRYWEAA